MTRDQVLQVARRATKVNLGVATLACIVTTYNAFGAKLMHHHIKDTVFYLAMAAINLMWMIHSWDDLQRLRVTDP